MGGGGGSGRGWKGDKVLDITLKLAAPFRGTAILAYDQAKKKKKAHSGNLLPVKYIHTGAIGETASYDDLEEREVKLGLILNDDFFCFRMTRKVSTTCSRNARAGS